MSDALTFKRIKFNNGLYFIDPQDPNGQIWSAQVKRAIKPLFRQGNLLTYRVKAAGFVLNIDVTVSPTGCTYKRGVVNCNWKKITVDESEVTVTPAYAKNTFGYSMPVNRVACVPTSSLPEQNPEFCVIDIKQVTSIPTYDTEELAVQRAEAVLRDNPNMNLLVVRVLKRTEKPINRRTEVVWS